MANTIELKLLENKRAEATVNGYPYALEGSYHIIAGEVNATKFILSSVPTKYSESEFTIVGYNAGKQEAKEFKGKTFRVGSEFYLPTGMAIAGYSQLNFSTITSDGESVKWLPIKLKIYNTMPNWADVSTNKAEELQGQIDEIKAKIEEGGTGGDVPDATPTVKGIATLGSAGGAATFESVQGLDEAITAEVERAQDAERELDTLLTAEEVRATAQEQDLNDKIDKFIAQMGGGGGSDIPVLELTLDEGQNVFDSAFEFTEAQTTTLTQFFTSYSDGNLPPMIKVRFIGQGMVSQNIPIAGDLTLLFTLMENTVNSEELGVTGHLYQYTAVFNKYRSLQSDGDLINGEGTVIFRFVISGGLKNGALEIELVKKTVDSIGGGTSIPTIDISSFTFLDSEGEKTFTEEESIKLTETTKSLPLFISLKDSQGTILTLKLTSATSNYTLYDVEIVVTLSKTIKAGLLHFNGKWVMDVACSDVNYIYNNSYWEFDEATHKLLSTVSDASLSSSVSNICQIDVYPLDNVAEKFLDEFLASNIVIWNEQSQRIELQLKDTCTQEDIPPSLQLRIVFINGSMPGD